MREWTRMPNRLPARWATFSCVACWITSGAGAERKAVLGNSESRFLALLGMTKFTETVRRYNHGDYSAAGNRRNHQAASQLLHRRRRRGHRDVRSTGEYLYLRNEPAA